MDPFQAFNECQDHLVALGRAHGERMELESLQRAVARAPSPGASEFLGELAALHALSRMEADRGWFLEAGYFEPPKGRAVRREVAALAAELREVAVEAVEAWGIPDPVLDALDAPPGHG
jgi:acyl-CoA oxidase